MPFENLPLSQLLDRTYSNYMSLLKPLDKTPRYNLIKVMASVQAGETHQLLGDLSFLARQLFPDTATGEYLRAHWSLKVPPLYAVQAIGTISITGVPLASVPAGLVYANAAGKRYYTSAAYKIGDDRTVTASVTAEEAGVDSNMAIGEDLTLVSSQSAGIDKIAKTNGTGITGGVDGESDEGYLVRVLNYLRNSIRYGKPGDFVAWAVDSSPEVSKAFEIKNFGVFGALLIQCIGGNQIEGVVQVGNLGVVESYIKAMAPPIICTIQTPRLISINPVISLLQNEDSLQNRELIKSRLQVYLNARAKPGVSFTQGLLKSVIIDGIDISDATLILPGGKIETTVLQYPILGEIIWN